MSDEEKKSKIITDEDWKQQAKQEKEKLKEQSQEEVESTDSKEKSGEGAPLPPPDFMTLVNSIVMQSFYHLGMINDPQSDKKPPVNLDMAKYNIDLLQVIEDKTKGNLNEQESQVLSMALHEIRMHYVQAAQK